jgi:tetratricopeptide (TPR) repeat protein
MKRLSIAGRCTSSFMLTGITTTARQRHSIQALLTLLRCYSQKGAGSDTAEMAQHHPFGNLVDLATSQRGLSSFAAASAPLSSMKTYHGLQSRTIQAMEKLSQEAELHTNELEYLGYTTVEVQTLKAIVMDIHTEETTDEALRAAGTRLHEILVEFCDSASGDSGLINRSDCHHIRFILSLYYRRIEEFPKAEALLWEILRDEPWNVDSVEGLLEIYVKSEDDMKKNLLPFLDHMVTVERADLAYSFLADFLLTAASRYYGEHGEGSTMNYIYSVLATLAGAIGPAHMGMMVEFLYNSFDEIHFNSKFSKSSDRDFISGLVVTFLKTLVAKRIYKTTQDPIAFEIHIQHKLLLAFTRLKRRQEAHSVGERILKAFRRPTSAEAAKRFREDSALADIYRETLFQYVESRSLDHQESGPARDLCIAAIEEFPTHAEPWKVLSAVLHRDKEYENAVIAAKKAVTLAPSDLACIALLSNLYAATGRRTLSEEMLERYKLLVIMHEQNASPEDLEQMRQQALDLDSHVQEEDIVDTQNKELNEHNKRMKLATLYSKSDVTAPLTDMTSVNLSVQRNPQMHSNMGDFLEVRDRALAAQRAGDKHVSVPSPEGVDVERSTPPPSV